MKTILMTVLALFVYAQVVSAAQYQVTDLGTLGGSSSRATDLNESGQVVGYSFVGGNGSQQAFMYSNGSMQNLDWQYGDAYSQANGINANGQVVGTAFHNGSWQAFLYQNGSMSFIYPSSGVWGGASKINDSGLIVGDNRLYSGTNNVGNIPMIGRDISNTGQIAGETSHASTYSNGPVRDLGTLGGNFSRAYGINDSGQVVGWAYASDDTMPHAFLYAGTMLGLNLETDVESQAYGINNSGQVVGFISRERDDSAHRAFLYDNGLMKNLNDFIDPTSGWTLRDASAINNVGQIVGYGINGLGQERAFLLTPIPEPATLSLLGFGLLALLRRRRIR